MSVARVPILLVENFKFGTVLDIYVFLHKYGYFSIFARTNMIFKTDISMSVQPKP